MKILFPLLVCLLLMACGKEKTELESVLAGKFKDDKDLQDYRIDPLKLADCVVSEVEKSVPGIPGTPKHRKIFAAHVAFQKAKSAEQKFKIVKDSAALFGSHQEASSALLDVTSSTLHCMGGVIPAPPDSENG